MLDQFLNPLYITDNAIDQHKLDLLFSICYTWGLGYRYVIELNTTLSSMRYGVSVMKIILSIFFIAVWCIAPLCDEAVILSIPNGGFEQGLEGWQIPDDEGISTISTEKAASGRYSLKIMDESSASGSNVTAKRVSISGSGVFEIRGQYFPVSGSGLGIYVRIFDKDGEVVGSGNSHVRGLGGSDKRWKLFTGTIYTSEEAAFLELWIHSYSSARVEGYLDDLEFVSMGEKGMKPPWEGQYKIKQGEKSRLTPADVVGPDGIVYPNWTKCGVQGGIPEVDAVVSIHDFGAKPDDDGDDSVALSKACEAAGKMGGGAVLLDEGTYYLDRPVTVRYDNVVIRGKGADRTKMIFRYAVPENGVGFYNPLPGSRVGKNTRIEMHCNPEGLTKMTMMVNDVVIGSWGIVHFAQDLSLR